MRVLLDTQAFLWWVGDAAQLTTRPRAVIANPDNECFLSLTSVWEMSIKARLGKLDLPKPVATFVPAQLHANDFRQLDIGFRDVARVETLPDHHRDPFDRLLIAQALGNDLTVVTSDKVFRKYGVRLAW